jgi:HK97 family phage portal protein
MGILTAIVGAEPRASAPAVVRSAADLSVSRLPTLMGVASSTGRRVSQATALQVSTVYACATIKAVDLARMRPRLYRVRPDRVLPNGDRVEGGRDEVRDGALARLLRRPNRAQTWLRFASMMQMGVELKANAIAVILRDPAGEPTEMFPINADRVTVLEAANGWVFYQVSRAGMFEQSVLAGMPMAIPAENVLHVRGVCVDTPLHAPSRIGLARDAIGLAMAQQEQAARWAGNGARPSGVLKSPKSLSTEAAQRLKAQWEAFNSGLGNTGRTAVLEEGMEWQQLSLSSVDLEFLAQRQFQVEDICRFFRVPPHKVGKMDRATNNNIAAQDQDYLNNTIAPEAENWEQELEFAFDLDAQGLEVELDESTLLRADPMTRRNIARIDKLTGLASTNELRAIEGRNPVEGGDALMQPTNMAALGSDVSGNAPDGAGRPAAGESPSP